MIFWYLDPQGKSYCWQYFPVGPVRDLQHSAGFIQNRRVAWPICLGLRQMTISISLSVSTCIHAPQSPSLSIYKCIVYTYTYVHTYIYIYIHMCVYHMMCIYIGTYLSVCIVCLFTCLLLAMYLLACLFMCLIHAHICMCT